MMNIPPRPFLLLSIVLGWISSHGCESSTGIEEFGDEPVAIIYGTVVDQEGQPIQAAEVLLEHRPHSCTGPRIEQDRVFTDASGFYRSVFFLGANIRATSCFVVLVNPPAESDLQPSPAIPFEVDFSLGFPDDSVRVDVTLSAE